MTKPIHIADTHADHAGKGICGRRINLDFYFTGLDHWFQDSRSPSPERACRDCVKVVLLAATAASKEPG